MIFHRENPSVSPVSSRPLDEGISIKRLLFSFRGRINRGNVLVFLLGLLHILYITVFLSRYRIFRPITRHRSE